MTNTGKYWLSLGCCVFLLLLNSVLDKKEAQGTDSPHIPSTSAHRIGWLEDDRLVECSGIDISLSSDNRLWAINDGGHGPFVYAMALNGKSLGRVSIHGARNRDWEGIDTFIWKGRPMILIADFGDNMQRHDTHTLYIIEEPNPNGEKYGESAEVEVAWHIVYSYPDRKHDAEGVAVDAKNRKVYVLTKRDNPPILFELPLVPSSKSQRIMAKKIAEVAQIPPPSNQDLDYKYGKYRSQPTALDFSPDGRHAAILTYKHAYLFNRKGSDSWADTLMAQPRVILLPLPQNQIDLIQREAICFTSGSHTLIVTSEGLGAGVFKTSINY